MKRFVLAAIAALFACAAHSQTTTINQLQQASTPLTGTETVPLWQSGSTKQVPLSSLYPPHLIFTPTFTWSGSGVNGGNSLFYGFENYSGTCSSSCWAHWFFINNWAVTNTSGQQAQNLTAMTYINSTAMTGGYSTITGGVGITGPTGNTSLNAFYQGAQFTAFATSPDNGTIGTPNGSLTGVSTSCSLLTGALNWQGCGNEFDLVIQTGASAKTMSGLGIVLLASNAVAATTDNLGFYVGAQGGAVPTLMCPYCLGSYNGTNALAAGAAVMTFEANGGGSVGPTIAYGIDFAGLRSGSAVPTITGCAFDSPGGFCVTGAGVVQTSVLAAPGANNLAIRSGTGDVVDIENNTGSIGLEVYNPNSAADDFIAATGVAAGNSIAILGTGGADANVSMRLSCKGTCKVAINPTGGADVLSASSAGVLAAPLLTTGTNGYTVCASSGLVIQIQAAPCTISSMRFKTNVQLLRDASPIMSLHVRAYNLKAPAEPIHDPNYTHRQVGLIAEEVAAIMPDCAIYEDDMRTPKAYRPECVMAFGVKVLQDHQQVLSRQQIEIYALLLWCLALTGWQFRRR